MLNTMAEFLGAAELTTETVSVDGFGDVTLRQMSGLARDKCEAFRDRKRNKEGFVVDFEGYRALCISQCVMDGAGNLMFAKPQDAQKINTLPADVVDGLFDHVDRMNLLTPAAQEEAEKNSDGGPNESPGTD